MSPEFVKYRKHDQPVTGSRTPGEESWEPAARQVRAESWGDSDEGDLESPGLSAAARAQELGACRKEPDGCSGK